MARELGPHEQAFEVTPRGIRYICEFCNEGEMVFLGDDTIKPQEPGGFQCMFQHKCDKCGKRMLLPRVYPYIDWTPTT